MFTTPLILQADSRPDLWSVAAALVWTDPLLGTVTVPAGFETDLASIPRLLRNLPDLDTNGLSRRPAVLHDYLYCMGCTTRDAADRTLQRALLAEGATRFTAWVYYTGVHWGGGAPWTRYRLGIPQR